jgi:hypothetical protein
MTGLADAGRRKVELKNYNKWILFAYPIYAGTLYIKDLSTY